MDDLKIIKLDNNNVEQYGCYCLKNKKLKGHSLNIEWLKKRFQEGLTVKFLNSEKDGNIGFIEYVSGENSWRSFSNPDYMFIHCLYIAKKTNRNQGYGKLLIDECIEDAVKENKRGIVVISSGGAMLADKDIFIQNGFTLSDTRPPKYQLLVKPFIKGELPKFTFNEENLLGDYKGLHLIYANQCPYTNKAVENIKKVAKEYCLELNILELNSAKEAQQTPSIYGVFNLIYDGELIAEHYISESRFKNILEKELHIKKQCK